MTNTTNTDTAYASALAYDFEAADKAGNTSNKEKISYVTDKLKTDIPSNLEFLESDRDASTGTAASAFKDRDTGEIIIAYTGTNLEVDPAKDVTTDLLSIGAGKGYHYEEAYNFYDKIAAKYGSENITLAGHSLGGNVAQRVALKYNVGNTVVYNSAPLYVENGPGSIALATSGVGTGTGVVTGPIGPMVGDLASSGVLLYSLINSGQIAENVDSINRDKENFTGNVTRITTEGDPLNNVTRNTGGVYIGDEYILDNSGGHSISGILQSDDQLSQINKLLYDPYLEAQAQRTLISASTNVETDMSSLKQLVEEFKTNDNQGQTADSSGLTGSEKIYVDYLQANSISGGLISVSNAAVVLVEAKEKVAISEAEKLLQNLEKPFATLLSDDEVKAAYKEGGVDETTIVEDVKTYCANKKKNFSDLSDTFTGIQGRISSGIQELVQTDADLAGLINGRTV